MIMQLKKELMGLNKEYNILTTMLGVSVSKHLLDDKFTVIWANDYYYELIGYTKEEYERLFNNDCRKYFENDLEEYEEIKKAVKEALESKEKIKKYDKICKMPCKDGKYLWVRLVGVLTNETFNGIPVVYTIYSDVSELIGTQIELREEHQKLDKTLLLEETTIECIKNLYKFHDLDIRISEVLEKIANVMEADATYIIKDEGRVFSVTYFYTKSENIKFFRVNSHLEFELLDEWQEEIRKGNSILVEDIEKFRYVSKRLYDLLEERNVRKMIISPVVSDGKIHTYFIIDNPSELILNRVSIIETISYFINGALENEKLNEVLTYNSYYDNLTGLFNRNKYLNDIEEIPRKDNTIGILFMDINGLKSINDLYGHHHGDTILKEAADILKTVFRDYNVYRIGGDEYVVLAVGIKEETFAQRVKELKQRLFSSKECRAAVGYKWLDNSKNIEKEIILVDKDMYEDKKEYYRHNQNLNRYRHNNDEILNICDQKILEKEINAKRFEIYLQPKVDFNYLIIGAEALVRYRDNNGKIVMPNDFIALLEYSRVINILDYHIFENVCQIIESWIKKKHDVKPISINFSRYTMKNIDFIERLNKIWNKYKIPKYLLEIEVIENDEETDPEILYQVLHKIKSEGYSLSIDDFGARYSNMALFIDTDLDTLKIDRSLMKNILDNKRAQILISSFVRICHNMDIQLIVEGVETNEEFELLRQLECDGIQGYLISKPIPLKEYENSFL